MSDDRPPRRLAPFLPTRQHRRFVEFADAVRRHRYIGACYGAPGIGKTLSARTYAAADDYDRWATDRFIRSAVLPPALHGQPHRDAHPRRHHHPPGARDPAAQSVPRPRTPTSPEHCARTSTSSCPANRDWASNCSSSTRPTDLKTAGLEQVRDYFDTGDIGLILIGMPGFERRLARYPQLYSRVGFAHQYRPLDSKDIPQVLAQYWQQLGLSFDPHRPADAESVVTIVRITGGNFRLIERLMSQVARVMTINNLDTITPDVVEAAREALVVGA